MTKNSNQGGSCLNLASAIELSKTADNSQTNPTKGMFRYILLQVFCEWIATVLVWTVFHVSRIKSHRKWCACDLGPRPTTSSLDWRSRVWSFASLDERTHLCLDLAPNAGFRDKVWVMKNRGRESFRRRSCLQNTPKAITCLVDSTIDRRASSAWSFCRPQFATFSQSVFGFFGSTFFSATAWGVQRHYYRVGSHLNFQTGQNEIFQSVPELSGTYRSCFVVKSISSMFWEVYWYSGLQALFVTVFQISYRPLVQKNIQKQLFARIFQLFPVGPHYGMLQNKF